MAKKLAGYTSPVAPGTHVMRQDQGQDYQGQPGQNVYAIGHGRVDYIKPDPGGFGNALYYTLANGQQIYVGHANPTVRPGQLVTPGMPIAQLLAHGGGNASNLSGWTEVGLASGGRPSYADPVGGQRFDAFLKGGGGSLVSSGTAPTPLQAASVGATPQPMGAQSGPYAPPPQPQPINPGQHVVTSKLPILGQSLAAEMLSQASALQSGGTPDLKNMFTLAKGFMSARRGMGNVRPAPLGGTALSQGAGMTNQAPAS